MPLSTVSAVLTRIGLGKRSRLEPPEPPDATSDAIPASCSIARRRRTTKKWPK